MNDVEISASGMNTFFNCPMAYWLGKQYRPRKIAQHFTDGTDAHALMEGKSVPDASQRAVDYAASLFDLKEKWDIQISKEHHEIKQIFEIWPGIKLHRIIDAIATVHDNLILVDWKTASSLDYWTKIPQASMSGTYTNVAPKAAGFQAIAYLIPPPDQMMKDLGIDHWPTTIYFAIGTTRGDNAIMPYTLQHGDIDSFKSAARIMAGSIRNNLFPMVRGDACHAGEPIQCGMLAACYETKGWENLYVEKPQNQPDETASGNGN